MSERAMLRAALAAMDAANLNRGTSGNASLRLQGATSSRFLITPTGIPAQALSAEDMVEMDLDGRAWGARAPSSEWRFHRDLYACRPECGAVVHAHSAFATALACLRRDIPPFHYMVARFGGATVRCSNYATFGTAALSAAALEALEDRSACLLANHGMLVAGRDIDHALGLAIELEALCEQYWRAATLGTPVLLDDAEMTRVLEKFRTYGQPQDPHAARD